ncbi:hypothetical protein OSH65_25805, partial [Mycobacterium ulcerans]
ILDHALKNLYDGVGMADVQQALILSARTLIEREPGYDFVTARLLLASLVTEIFGHPVTAESLPESYTAYLPTFIRRGIDTELLDP